MVNIDWCFIQIGPGEKAIDLVINLRFTRPTRHTGKRIKIVESTFNTDLTEILTSRYSFTECHDSKQHVVLIFTYSTIISITLNININISLVAYSWL